MMGSRAERGQALHAAPTDDSPHPSWTRGAYTIVTDPARIDLDAVCAFLGRAYWASRRSREVIARSLQHSIPFGVLEGAHLVAFARVISDRATYAYLADVFVEESRRGAGLGTILMECIMGHPALQGLERWSLATRDAHALYRKFGFQELLKPERHMEIPRRDS
jgi:GNAT superfamily N-acetyltransferase